MNSQTNNSKISPTIKDCLKFARYMYFPLSKKEKKDILSTFEEKVEKYSPLIEKRTGIEMGKVEVKPFNQLTDEIIDKVSSEKDYCTPGWFSKNIIVKPIFNLVRMTAEEIVMGKYGDYDTPSIYVPLGYSMKMELFGNYMAKKGQKIDEIVVHELTHHLWRQINPKDKGITGKNSSLWNEGFATYGATRWFKEFYPSSNLETNQPSKYLKGRNKIEKLVEEKGESALLEIPNKWKEFDKEFNQSISR